MLSKLQFKRVIPHLTAVVLFYLVPLIYFSPVMQGYSIIQGDISSFKGMAKSYVDHRETYNEEALWTDAMFSGMPAYQVAVGYFSNVLRYIDRFISIHLFWEGPHLLLFLCMVSFYILCITLSVHPWLAMAGSFGFGFSSYFPILIEAGHNAKLHAIAYLPGALAGFLMVWRGNMLRGGVLFGCFMSLEILSNHIQVTYYFGIMLAIFILFNGYEMVRNGNYKTLIQVLSVLIAGGLLAVLSNAAILWNTYKYAQETMRGGSELTIVPGGAKNENKTSGLDLDYLTQWSQGISETWSLLVPEVQGGGSGPVEYDRGRQVNAYFGDQPFTSGPVYAGAFMVFLFVLGFFVLTGSWRWAVLVSTILFLMIAWGRNMMWFTELLAENLPMYNKFRTPSMALLIVELLIPVSAVLVLSKYASVDFWKQLKLRKPLLYTTGAVGGILLLFAMAPGSFFDLMSDQEQAEFAGYMSGASAAQAGKAMDEIETFRAGIIRSDALRSLFFVLLGLCALWFFGRRKDLRMLGFSLAAICLLDLWLVDKRYVNNEKRAGKYLRWEKKKPNYFHEHLPNQADESIFNSARSENPHLNSLITQAEQKALSDLPRSEKAFEPYALANARYRVYTQNTHFRVYQLNNPFNESKTSFFHKSVGGYSAVKMGRYQDIIDFYLRNEAEAVIGSLKNGGQDIQQVMAGLNVLNMLNTRFIIYNPEAPALPNSSALGNAWFVENIQPAINADREIMMIADLDVRTEAAMRQSDVAQLKSLTYTPGGNIILVKYKANELVYSVEGRQADGFAVFSEIYYKHGWQAYLDGQKVQHYKVNYILRGLLVPAGTKQIIFRFEPADYPVSNAVGYASSILLLLLAIGFIAVDVRRSISANVESQQTV